MSDIPLEVAAAWKKAHDALQAQLEFFYARGAAGKVLGELSFEAGVPRIAEFYGHHREQVGSREAFLQATRRKRA